MMPRKLLFFCHHSCLCNSGNVLLPLVWFTYVCIFQNHMVDTLACNGNITSVYGWTSFIWAQFGLECVWKRSQSNEPTPRKWTTKQMIEVHRRCGFFLMNEHQHTGGKTRPNQNTNGFHSKVSINYTLNITCSSHRNEMYFTCYKKHEWFKSDTANLGVAKTEHHFWNTSLPFH